VVPHVEIVVEPVDAVVAPFFTDAVTMTFRFVAALLTERALDVPVTRVLAAHDLLAAVTSESARLGLPPDRRKGLERVGGALAGKCLRAEDGRRATVVLPLELARAVDGDCQLLGVEVVTHELAHVLYGAIRDTEVDRIEGVSLPWEVAEVVAILAAEEFRVDQIGRVLVEKIVTTTDEDGKEIPLANLPPQFLQRLPAALNVFSPDLEETIQQYRVLQIPLEDMWNAVARASEGIALYMAHTEAANVQEHHAIEEVDHPAVELLEPLWRPLFDHLRDTPMLLQAGEWATDRARLRQIGRDGFVEVWRRLGLEARPEGDGFYLSVTDPPWSGTANDV
jgi:hypothetical protein